MSRINLYGDDTDPSGELDGFGNQCKFPRQSDWERTGFTMQAPPLGKWTVDWIRNGFMRKEIVGFAIESAENELNLWRFSEDDYARFRLNIAYENLGDILNWLYVRK